MPDVIASIGSENNSTIDQPETARVSPESTNADTGEGKITPERSSLMQKAACYVGQRNCRCDEINLLVDEGVLSSWCDSRLGLGKCTFTLGPAI